MYIHVASLLAIKQLNKKYQLQKYKKSATCIYIVFPSTITCNIHVYINYVHVHVPVILI